MTLRKTSLALLVAAALSPLALHAQYSYPPAAPAPAQMPQRAFTQAELDQMLAPIALYPDSLLSQVLMAATYPVEVVEAARWTRANPGLQGDAAVRAVEGQIWDPSVKSLVAFPEILQRMDEQVSWTESLGDAFLAQEAALMDTVQQLRRRAQAQGNLQSSEQIRVEQQGPAILIEPASPQYVYVPYYDPLVVYGNWWWPAYRPISWAPWPGYARPYRPGLSASFWWGRPVYVNRGFVADRGRWQHDSAHRSVRYNAPEVRQRFANPQPARRADRQPAQFQAQPAARVQAQPQPAAQPRFERREERQAARVQAQPQARQEQRPQPQARQEHRHEQRASMPAAQAPQQPRAEQQERREERREHRPERGQKS